MHRKFAALIFAVALALPTFAHGQFGQQPPAAEAKLDPASTATIDRIAGVQMHIDMAPGRPNPLDLRTQFLVAQKLLPWVSTDQPKDLATLTSAIKAVDLNALDKADQTAFDASLRKSLALLEALRPM